MRSGAIQPKAANEHGLLAGCKSLDCRVQTLLLLDDLGAWKMTDWMNDTLFYILNSRYLSKRATLITTNHQDVDKEKVMAADSLTRREFLVERIGQRLRSRLMEMCVVVPMHGPDFRRQRQEGLQVEVRGGLPER